MFSYYGSKSKIVHLYPAPKHGLIIEPFAGSARYALKYFDRDVILCDKYKVIIDVWKYLQQASEKDILGLPRFKQGDELKHFNLSEPERLFCGFLVAKGVTRPQNKTSKFTTTLQPTWIPYQLQHISKQLFKIRHWKLIHGTYECLGNTEATWFVDSPYFQGGEHYRENNKSLNYEELSLWCKSRQGQVIVCENSRADWLPFKIFSDLQGTRKPSAEAFWTNEEIEYQEGLFNAQMP